MPPGRRAWAESLAFPVPNRDSAIHGRCGKVRQPDDRSTRIPNTLSPLPSGSRRPVMAMKDPPLLKRVEQYLAIFLSEHELTSAVLSKTRELLRQAPVSLLCTHGPTCTATIHDLRVRVLEPQRGESSVRFDMILSTHLGIFAEAGAYPSHALAFTCPQAYAGFCGSSVVNPQNPQEVGLLYSSMFQIIAAVQCLHMEIPFTFDRGSVALMFLASMIDQFAKVSEPPFEIVQRLFDQAKTGNISNAKKPRVRRDPRRRKLHDGWSPPSSVEVFSVHNYRVQTKLSPAVWPASLCIRGLLSVKADRP
ncbi:BQ2448_7849 [Microbotryum intermedium]|uniref:BQ2448_7849 protein n=1 Tax=Microbotryum intermedium TaxID=269621 RepID=A0A238FM33_9BASI|nr:BQ2448_7849 [Microbotryum intermedium]